MLACAGYFISIFFGLMLCVTLEFPFTALLKELFGKVSNENEDENSATPRIKKDVEEVLTNGNTEIDDSKL